MSDLKRFFCFLLILATILTLFTGCDTVSPFSKLKAIEKETETETEEPEATVTETPSPALGISFDYEGIKYYLWEDGIATDSEQYNPDSGLAWEKDSKTLELVVKNTVIDIPVARYSYRTVPNLLRKIEIDGTTYYLWDDDVATKTEGYDENSELHWSRDEDTYSVFNQNDVEIASYENPELLREINTGSVTYYLWNVTEEIRKATQGVCTTTAEYNEEEGLRWTQPWEGRFIIYNGDYTNGYVVYSEFACSTCGIHKIYYCRIAAEGTDLVRYYFCSSCNAQYESTHKRCPKCQSYWCYKGAEMCDHCWYNS